MFCPGCATQIQTGLKYCKNCGRRVAEDHSERPSAAENLSGAVGYVGGFGLLGFLFVVIVLVKKGISDIALIPIAFFYLAALFGICFLMIRQSAALARGASGERKNFEEARPQPYLQPLTTAQLEEPRDSGIGSVTEHTTRTLDEIAIERK